jgi:LysM repeat protein
LCFFDLAADLPSGLACHERVTDSRVAENEKIISDDVMVGERLCPSGQVHPSTGPGRQPTKYEVRRVVQYSLSQDRQDATLKQQIVNQTSATPGLTVPP